MLTIGEVAKRVGIRASAVRYYESRGIIPQAVRLENGYRVYSPESIKLLLFAVRARSVGITLKEIKSILDLILAGKNP
jgi:DNA-binding transcriptional MerR regulator